MCSEHFVCVLVHAVVHKEVFSIQFKLDRMSGKTKSLLNYAHLKESCVVITLCLIGHKYLAFIVRIKS